MVVTNISPGFGLLGQSVSLCKTLPGYNVTTHNICTICLLYLVLNSHRQLDLNSTSTLDTPTSLWWVRVTLFEDHRQRARLGSQNATHALRPLPDQ